MEQVVLVIHLLIALALVGVILLQKSDGGALGGLGGGMSGGGASFGGLFTARGGASFLTRTTAILAASFIATSLLLAILATGREEGSSILEDMPVEAPATAPQPDVPAAPSEPAGEPSAPEAPIAN
jgi:preprotein translocase subunit SecG